VRDGRLQLRATIFFLDLCSAQPPFLMIYDMKDFVTNFFTSSERVFLMIFGLMIYAVEMI
jgi:hypothetical protein